jgi:threonine/homoserine/homoserine lactone efflux protein
MLTQAIGDLLPSAVGVAISPIPIIANILMLGTPKARANGPAFAAGWLIGLIAVSVIVLTVAGGADDADSSTATGVNGVLVAVGLLFVVLGVRQWRSRPAKGETPELPSWMAAIDTFTAGKSLGLGIVLSAANPKNLALTAAGAAAIAQAGLDAGESAVAVAVFVAVASLTVVGPVAFYLAASDKAAQPLGALKEFMADHNAAIMTVLFFVLGAKILGNGFAGVSN